MRPDSLGLFWQDLPRKKGDRMARIMPDIPDTGWVAPTEFPNLSAAKALSIDVETYDPELKKQGPGWARGVGHLVGIAVGTEDGHRWYFPMRHEISPEENLDPNHVLTWAKDNLTDPHQVKIGANITYDVGWLRQEGIHVQGALHDVQFAEALLREQATVNLDDLGERYLEEGKTGSILYDWCSAYYGGPETQVQRANIYRAPPNLVGPYAIGDVDLPFRILEKQWPLLIADNLREVYSIECRLIYLMIEMRFTGVRIDLQVAEQLRDRMIQELKIVDSQMKDMVGFEVNTNASESLARAFDEQGIPYGFTGKGNPSFTKKFLETVDHPLADLVLTKKAREKLKGTFIESYLLESHREGRVYGQFHQLRSDASGTRSGRLSSSTPNLQNIPSRSELGNLIRTAFVPDHNHASWQKVDYSQIEYRGLAHYAQGPGAEQVRERYRNEPTIDFHGIVKEFVSSITGITLDRTTVKNVNFGTVYGMGEPGLAKYINVPMKKAKELFSTIHTAAPFIRSTMDATMAEAEELGYITTILGRRSRFDLWVPKHFGKTAVTPVPFEQAILMYASPRRAYIHKALNRRLQGSAADLIKYAMLLLWEAGLFDDVGVPKLTVHDELDFSDPGGKEDIFKEIYHIMRTALPFSVPIEIDIEVGPSWGTLKKVANP